MNPSPTFKDYVVVVPKPLQSLYSFPLDVTRRMVYTVGIRTVLAHYILYQPFLICYLIT